MANLIDSYELGSTGAAAFLASNWGTTGVAQSFVVPSGGTTLYSAKFWLHKSGAPSGNLSFKIYNISGSPGSTAAPTGAAIATSNTLTATTLTTSSVLTELLFTGVNVIYLPAGSYEVAIEYSGGDTSNYVLVSRVGSSASGNAAYQATAGSAYTSNSFDDSSFYVYGVDALTSSRDQIGSAYIASPLSSFVAIDGMPGGWGVSGYGRQAAGEILRPVVTTTDRTQIGNARIQYTTDRTQSANARITLLVSRTQLGNARVTATTDRTIVGNARILQVVDRSIVGNTRITLVTDKDQLGNANILSPVVATDKDQIGNANILNTLDRTQVGNARIQFTTDRDQTANARIALVLDRVQPGNARITQILDRIIIGNARLQYTTDKDQVGNSRIQYTTDAVIIGNSRIERIVSRDIIGNATILSAYERNQIGNMRVVRTPSWDQVGHALIAQEYLKTQIGSAFIIRVNDYGTKPRVSIVSNTPGIGVINRLNSPTIDRDVSSGQMRTERPRMNIVRSKPRGIQ